MDQVAVKNFIDLEFFHENGYLVVPNVVPPENLEAVLAAIWQFLEMDPDDTSTWYPPDRKGSLAHLHQHQALWENRQHPRVHQAFADILCTEKLWVSMDRATMKPPVDPRFPHYEDRGFVHWDLDTSKPLPGWNTLLGATTAPAGEPYLTRSNPLLGATAAPAGGPYLSQRLGVQGVLALADTTAEMGSFHCIPGFHRVLEQWIREQPEDRNPRVPDLSRLPAGFAVTPIPMQAGDLVIWDRRLAHGNGRNTGERPRLAQYLTMYPASDDEAQRQERIACWRDRHAPSYWERDIPEKYRGREQRNPPAELTSLGRRLLGLDRW